MATLTARLDKLETLANPKAPQLILFLVRQAGTESAGDDSITGIRFGDGRILLRQQGEGLDALQGRARAMIAGSGVVTLFAVYADFADFANR